MILRRLRVQRFLGLGDESLEFAPGVNVIVGPNEAGKSTLRLAIRTALYGNPAGTSAKVRDELRTWGEAEAPALYLEFEVEGRGFALYKDYASRKIILNGGGKTWDSHKLVQEQLALVLGLPTVELFEATAQVAQTELERIHLTSIANELSRLVGGGGEDVAMAIRRLEQRIKEMERGSKSLAKEPGMLKTLENRANTYRSQVQHLTAASADAERKQQELAQVKAQLTDREEEYATKQALLEINRQILQDVERLEGVRQQEIMVAEKIAQIEQTLTRLGDLARKIEAATAQGMPDEKATRTARMLADRLAMREQEALHLQTELEQTQPPHTGWGWIALAAVGAVLALVGASLAVARVPLGWWAVTAGALSVALGMWWRLKTVQEERFDAARLQEKTERLRDLEAEIDQHHQQLSNQLAALHASSLDEAEHRLRDYQDLVRARTATIEMLEKMRGESSDEALRERWNKLRLDVFGLEERLRAPEKAGRRLLPLEVQGLEAQVNRLADDVKRLLDQERRLSIQLEHLRGDADTLAELEEQLQETEDALAAARRQHAVFTAALAGLVEARRQAEVPVREVVAGKSSEYLRILTEGLYDQLEVEKDSLQVKVWSSRAGGWVLPEEPHLSRGTVDLVYLSARLALVSVLAEGRRPPLLLDDPFVAFDDRRRAAAARLLNELSGSHQIFLFTCSRHFDTVADRVIELAPRIVQAAPDEAVQPSAEPEARPVGPLWERSQSPS